MLNFNFADKGKVLVFPLYFVYDFSRKCFSGYILLTDQMSLSDCLYFPKYWVIYVWQKRKYLENEKRFLGEIKSIFHPF